MPLDTGPACPNLTRRRRRRKEESVPAIGSEWSPPESNVCPIPVYYPGARRFAPDIFVVFDVPDHDRDSWVVSAEGKGLDFVLEVHAGGDRKKDMVRHPQFYASLGIPEYFVFDRAKVAVHGWRFATPQSLAYTPIVPHLGRYAAQSLGLELGLEQCNLRFFHATARLEQGRELIERLGNALGQVQARLDDEQAARETVTAALAAEAAARQAVEKQLAEALAEIARLRGEAKAGV